MSSLKKNLSLEIEYSINSANMFCTLHEGLGSKKTLLVKFRLRLDTTSVRTNSDVYLDLFDYTAPTSSVFKVITPDVRRIMTLMGAMCFIHENYGSSYASVCVEQFSERKDVSIQPTVLRFNRPEYQIIQDLNTDPIVFSYKGPAPFWQDIAEQVGKYLSEMLSSPLQLNVDIDGLVTSFTV